MKSVFSACPHDVILDPEKWTAFAKYVQKKSGHEFEFKRFESFDIFAQNFDSFNFVYAHPLHAVQLGREKGYLPLAKYTETYDEAVVISRKTETGSDVQKIAGRSVACIHGSPSHAALLIDLHKAGHELEFEEIHRDAYPKVLMSVGIGEADFGVILKSVWDDMLTMKERVRVHCTTSSHSLVHVFMLSPRLESELEKFRSMLTSMTNDEEGREILGRLKCPSISAFSASDLKELEGQLSVCNYHSHKAA
jgi:ABC-type phosphate/phosphonate transport system substrate-binding protein